MTRLLIRRDGDNNWRTPEVTAYDNESALQRLLAESPHLLPGIDEDSVAAAIEFPVPETGNADLVSVDAEGNITIVECKLRANPEIRRQVVGQVFAYAAGMSSMDFEQFEAAFSSAADQPLMQQLGSDTADAEPVRAVISDNLADGRFRLIIAVDEITPELQRVVRYINRHTTSDVELLAIELRYIRHSDFEILVPEVYGEESAQQKASGRKGRKWDEQCLFDALATLCTPESVRGARTLFDWLKSRSTEVRWGQGIMPSVTFRLPIEGKVVSVVSMYAWQGSRGYLQVNYRYLIGAGTSVERLETSVERLRAIPELPSQLEGIEAAGFGKHPSVWINGLLDQPGVVDRFIAAIEVLLEDEIEI